MRSTTHEVDDIYAQMDKDGKSVKSVPTSTFLAATVVGIPLCAAVAPISILYQAGKLLLKPFVPQPTRLPIDSGTVVDSKDVVPHEKRKYDIVLLGATGFTGRLAARHLAKTYGVGKEVKWAIAGRSTSKLDSIKSELAEELGSNEVMNVDTLIVDTSNVDSLPTLVNNTRVVITTAGPFRQYGSPVVEFCAKYGTHYADITAETDWVRNMMVQWEETAQRTGARLVSFCGHDSVPWDFTVMKLEEQLPDDEELVSVECFDEVSGGVSGGSIATAFGVAQGTAAPKHSDYDVFLKLPDGRKSSADVKADLPFTVAKANRAIPRFRNMYTWFFPLSPPNSEVVKRSAALRERSKNFLYKEAAIASDSKTAFMTLSGLVGLGIGLSNPITGYLLRKHVLPKPGEGPSLKRMEKGSFLAVTGHGIGSKGTEIQSVMYFPRDVGYLDTARMLVESGLALALDHDKLPAKGGGFFTASTCMGQVLLDRICRTGTYFATKTLATKKQ